MATSDVDIANRSLDLIGARSTVSSIGPSDGSNEANTISRHYDACRQMLLRSAHWNFARKQFLLTQIGDANDGTALVPWQYEYSYPSDCVKMRTVCVNPQQSGDFGVPLFSSSQTQAYGNAENLIPTMFLIGNDQDSAGNPIKVVLTNTYQAIGVYTADIDLPDFWDVSFQEAMVTALAARIAMPLTGDKAMFTAMANSATMQIEQARVSDGNEGLTIMDHMPDWIRARGYIGAGFPGVYFQTWDQFNFGYGIVA